MMAKLAAHYTDPRLVALYDIENSRGADTDFYLDLVTQVDAQQIIDLGCGTGALTMELATEGRSVTGVDPAASMLAIARQKKGGERVTWIEGDASVLGAAEADLVVMTGNVAPVFLEDAEWDMTLAHIYAALREGGYLAFESRNPDDRAWERWTPETTYAEFESPFGLMASWLEVTDVGNDRVRMVGHNVFKATGEVVTARDELRFRSQVEICESLRKVGFVVEQVYGDWQRGAMSDKSRVMVFVARRG